MALATPSITWAEVLNIARQTIPSLKEDDFAATICNMALNLIWAEFDWRESVKPLNPLFLTARQQDYGAPATVIPSNFAGLRKVQLNDLFASPITSIQLRPLRFLDRTYAMRMPESVGYAPEVAALRVWPNVPDGIVAPRWTISGTYKINPPSVTASTLNTAVPFQDKYILVLLNAVRWAAASVGGNPEVAQLKLEIAKMSIRDMASQEGLDLGDTVVHPSSPIGFSSRGLLWSPRWPGAGY
jgi:hypothetical protein